MLKIQTIAIFVLLSAFIASCGVKESSKSPKTESNFDLQGFFREEANFLKTRSGIKQVAIDGNTITDSVKGEMLEADLLAFQQFDPNKPALIGKYSIDTVFAGKGSVRSISYTANEEKFPTRLARISFSGGEVDSVSLFIQKKNPVYRFDQTLQYVKGRGYSIIKEQKVILFSKKTYEIEVVLINGQQG